MAEEWVQKFETLQLHAGYVGLVVIGQGHTLELLLTIERE